MRAKLTDNLIIKEFFILYYQKNCFLSAPHMIQVTVSLRENSKLCFTDDEIRQRMHFKVFGLLPVIFKNASNAKVLATA